eukprot:TRINITY_DN34545_c0_g1_i1.p2 TRINITY_DN34545_c0_g1~~TRINITY_DN34545_c0_g1_i1.p2  ORF type:complete len:140 (+),score=46.07 TRINITY_DN34545_c0_g1_i1:108-527(+)
MDSVVPAATSTKKKKKKATPNHPKYAEMVTEAVATLNDRTGSSVAAIRKYILQSYPIPDDVNFKTQLRMGLRRCVSKGHLVKTKASYRLSPEIKAAIRPPRHRRKKEKVPVLGYRHAGSEEETEEEGEQDEEDDDDEEA